MKRLLLFLAFPFLLVAQTPTQVKGFGGGGQGRYDITLEPTLPGQAILLYFYGGNYQWDSNLAACAVVSAHSCDWNLFDSQGNQFAQINRDNFKLLYVPASKGGPETITIAFAFNQSLSAVVMVFPDTLVLQDVVPAGCFFRLQEAGENQVCFPWGGTGSELGSDDTTTLSSFSLVSSVQNELFIGTGQFGAPQQFTPEDGWAPLLIGHETFMSYKTAATVGTTETFTVYASPALFEGQYAYLGIQGFKVIPIQ
jgi:hypothetical protein